MFFPMGRWLIIWGVAGLLLVGAAYRSTPHPPAPEHDFVRLVLTVFPWAALWASLVANVPLPSTLRRVHHVTAGSVLALMVVACAFVIARAGNSLTPLSTRLYLLGGMGAALFAVFGTGWAVVASLTWRRTRTSGVLAETRLA